MTPEETHAVDTTIAAHANGDRERLRLALHPYLHWTTTSGELIRGRTNVLAIIDDEERLTPPAAVELRDGQIYRWTANTSTR